jgi:hypothetical protein
MADLIRGPPRPGLTICAPWLMRSKGGKIAGVADPAGSRRACGAIDLGLEAELGLRPRAGATGMVGSGSAPPARCGNRRTGRQHSNSTAQADPTAVGR